MNRKLFVFFAAASAFAVYGQNLIYNGDFEFGTDGFALHRIVTRNDRKHIPLKTDTVNVAKGEKSLCLSNPDGDYFELYISSFELKPNTNYTFSMTAKTDVRGGIPLEALIHDMDWHNKRKRFRIGNEFTTYSFTFNTKKHGGRNMVRLWSFDRNLKDGGWKGNLWLDRVSITETGKSAESLHAGIAGEKYIRIIGEDESEARYLNLQNDSKQDYDGTLTVKTISLTDSQTVAAETVKVSLKAGEKKTIPLSGKGGAKYGIYMIKVEGRGVTSREFVYGVIGRSRRVPRDFAKDFCVGINSGAGYRAGYVNGKLIERNGYHTYNHFPEKKFELLNLVGIRIVREWDGGRLAADWPTAEPESGKYDFSFFNSFLETMEKYDLVPIHVLGGELFRQPYLGNSGNGSSRENPLPQWALPAAERPEKLEPYMMQKLKGRIAYPSPEQWKRFMTALAANAKGKRQYFEFTNEPNLYITPEKYVRLLKATYEGLKSGDPGAQVIGFCCTSDFEADGSGWLERAVKAGGLPYCDILSFHPYSMRELGSLKPADLEIQKIRRLATIRGKQIPIWNTEQYYLYDTDKSAQTEPYPEYLLTRMLIDCGEGVAQAQLIHDGMIWNDTNFLMYKGDFIPGPHFIALNTFARLFEAAEPVAKHRLANGGICYVFRKDGKLIAAVWNYLKRPDVLLDLNRFEVLDLFGNPLKSGILPFTIKPYYLRQENMSEDEFQKACGALKPYMSFPIQTSSHVRLADNMLAAGLMNSSDKPVSVFAGFNGGGYTALHPVSLTLKPGEHKTVLIPLKRAVGNHESTRLILYSGTMMQYPVTVVKCETWKNGTIRTVRSRDGKLSVSVQPEVRNGKFHLIVRVGDATDAGANGSRMPWETDSIELFLDPEPLDLPEFKADVYHSNISRIFITPRDRSPVTIWSKSLKSNDLKSSVKKEKDGYTLSLELPTKGLPYGFGIHVNDAENASGKSVRKVSCGLGEKAYRNRLVFGIIK